MYIHRYAIKNINFSQFLCQQKSEKASPETHLFQGVEIRLHADDVKIVVVKNQQPIDLGSAGMCNLRHIFVFMEMLQMRTYVRMFVYAVSFCDYVHR
jgi:hypothetical protein